MKLQASARLSNSRHPVLLDLVGRGVARLAVKAAYPLSPAVSCPMHSSAVDAAGDTVFTQTIWCGKRGILALAKSTRPIFTAET